MRRRVVLAAAAAILACGLVAVAALPQGKTSAWTAPSSEQVNAIYGDVEALYFDLHRNPELAFHEERTAAKLAERVKALGFEVTAGVGGTGIVAVLRNGAGPTVMLRTELDALPVQEKTGLAFASTVSFKTDSGETVPVMHACGHDIHMSAWVGTARLMAENRQRWHGTLVLVGQPAEEIVSGAAAMLKDGLFTRFPKPDFALSLHDESSLAAGVVGFHAGYFRASADSVDITIYGRGGHGAAPQDTVDPIVIAARTVLALQSIVSRENNPMDPAVITVGTIRGGTKNNIIPEEVKLQLTVRAFSPEVRKRLLAAIERTAKGEAMAGGAPREPLVKIDPGTDVVYNDPGLTARVVASLRKVMGAQNVLEMPAKMTSEDFSQYGLAGVPSLLLHFGAVDPAKLAAAKQSGTPLPGPHSPQWAPEREPSIKTAIVVETTALLELLAH
ncbi:MAG TPA: amidohydrolase [Methylomirabilota bacterium]|nr:amidohydrolase [Methylomirabilota bacterium]